MTKKMPAVMARMARRKRKEIPPLVQKAQHDAYALYSRLTMFNFKGTADKPGKLRGLVVTISPCSYYNPFQLGKGKILVTLIYNGEITVDVFFEEYQKAVEVPEGEDSPEEPTFVTEISTESVVFGYPSDFFNCRAELEVDEPLIDTLINFRKGDNPSEFQRTCEHVANEAHAKKAA